MQHYSGHIDRLIERLGKLPGVGYKTAQRLAFYIINMPQEEVTGLADAIRNAKENIAYCQTCYNISDKDPCSICNSPNRDESLICVVEDPRDVAAMERTREYHGKYHVLHGTISPSSAVTPDMIRIRELVSRLHDDKVKEVIIATNTTIDGEATAMYIARLIKPFGIKVTRIAHGLPVGANLEFADDVTIGKALEGRREIL
ncbi:recombination mediator RecR [Filifactor villosus]|uniref:Recombination protein RecR n=1 Tax=Filifactor villosus TaxID=29374 RepID=A0ABV9QMN0_9FIRM